MADQKLTALTEDTAPTPDDMVYVVNDPAGTPASRKVKLSNLRNSFTTTATAAGTTTLTVNSTIYQIFTGATTQTVVMPVTSTLTVGQIFKVINDSTGALTINSSGGNLIKTLPTLGRCEVICTLITGTTAASWTILTTPILDNGQWTPTLTNTTNLAASTVGECNYLRVGNIVTGGFSLAVDPTAAGACRLGVSLPIASAFTTGNEASGSGVSFVPSGAVETASVVADAANDRFQIDWVAVNTANHAMYFNFAYIIK